MHIIYHFRVRGLGAERVHICGISKAFKELGNTICFVSPIGIDPTSKTSENQERNSIKSGYKKLFKIVADIMPQFIFELMEISYNLVGVIKLITAIREKRPDLIYERHAFFNFSGAFVSTLLDIPLVVEVNELAGFERVRGQILVKLAKKIEKYVFNRAYIVSSVSDFLTEQIDIVTTNKTRKMTIPNGIDREWAKLPPKKEIDIIRSEVGFINNVIICFVGGLVRWHNFPLMFTALKKLVINNANVRMIIVGDGPLKNELIQLAEQLGIRREIKFTGNVLHNEVRQYIAGSDIAIIPETNLYRSPIKMFEYMAMGKPVVAPKMRPIQSVLEDGLEGILFKPGSVDSLFNAINIIIYNEELRLNLGSNARKKVKEHYLWCHHAKKILDAIDK